MNYRHAFHAGNFADVFKHAVLTRLVEYLKRKEPAFRVLDTHAGAGSYDLMSEEARRGGEWENGIGRLFKSPLSDMSRQLLAPYLAACGLNPSTGTVRTYPGSPRLIRSLLRKQDRLSAYELHEDEYAQLAHLLAGDFQARATRLDGWLVAGAHLPPKEKRGLMFIDPPFETSDDFARIFDTMTKAHQRWAGGMLAAWYPVKDKSMVDTFRILVSDTGPPDVIDVRFQVAEAREEGGLVACGMLVKNPPFLFEPELRVLLPELVRVLGSDGAAAYSIERLTEE